MLNLYLSHKAFKEGLESDSPLKHFISDTEYVRIKCADQDLADAFKNKDSELFTHALVNELNLTSGIALSEQVKKKGRDGKGKIRNGLSSSIFVLGGIDRAKASKIGDSLGVLCIPDDDVRAEDFPENTKITVKRGGACGSLWKDLLSKVSVLPINSIVINDRYIDTINKQNVVDFLSALLRRQYPFNIQVLFLIGVRENLKVEKQEQIMTDFQNDVIGPVSRKTSNRITVEYVFCDGTDTKNWPLFLDTHNRFFFTNYSFVSAQNGLGAFDNDGKAKYLQTISCSSVKKDRSEYHAYRSSIANDINDALEKDNCPYACYRINDKNEPESIEIYKIMNKQITDLQDGDMCYYLSVPYSNGWAEAKCKGPYTYDSVKYHSCMCSRRKKNIDEKIEKIKNLFNNIDAKILASEKSDRFYRISVSTPSDLTESLIIWECKMKDFENQKRDYHNNYFVSKEAAEEIARSLCMLMGIEYSVIFKVD